MRTTIQHTSKIVSAAWLFILILSGCGQTELEGLLPDSDDSSTGEPVELRISLADSPEYHNETTSTPATRSGEPLIGEWVKVNSFSATRSANEYEGPAIAAMELFEDSVSGTPQTRANMADGYYFRLIAFRKVDKNSYVFQSVADYTARGTNAPVLARGKMMLPMGQTYRFVAYSFNNNSPMDDPLDDYIWNSTAISIPNLKNDFMTFVSEEKKVSGETFALPISFTHQLCKLTVKITATGFSDNTFTECTGVYIELGGSSSSWPVGASAIAGNTQNTATFDIADNNASTSTRIVPFASARAITVHFGTLKVGGKDAGNSSITSTQNVQLQAGKSYTMQVQFKKMIGIRVPYEDINLTAGGCTEDDKKGLSALIWAEGNLKSTGGVNSKNYVWGASKEGGYYYTWRSVFTGEGSTDSSGTDPCAELDVSIYGSGWRTPEASELGMLSRCRSAGLMSGGMYFMNSSSGLYLPFNGIRGMGQGCGTGEGSGVGQYGRYWAFTESGYHALVLSMGSAKMTLVGAPFYGYSVRCVKGPM